MSSRKAGGIGVIKKEKRDREERRRYVTGTIDGKENRMRSKGINLPIPWTPSSPPCAA
jgi:hypothetical protein